MADIFIYFLSFLLKFEFHCITEAGGSGDITKEPSLCYKDWQLATGKRG